MCSVFTIESQCTNVPCTKETLRVRAENTFCSGLRNRTLPCEKVNKRRLIKFSYAAEEYVFISYLACERTGATNPAEEVHKVGRTSAWAWFL